MYKNLLNFVKITWQLSWYLTLKCQFQFASLSLTSPRFCLPVLEFVPQILLYYYSNFCWFKLQYITGFFILNNYSMKLLIKLHTVRVTGDANKNFMSRYQSLSGSVGDWGLEAPPPTTNSIIVAIQPLTVSYLAEKKLAHHQHLISARFVSNLGLRLEPADSCFYLRYSVSYI